LPETLRGMVGVQPRVRGRDTGPSLWWRPPMALQLRGCLVVFGILQCTDDSLGRETVRTALQRERCLARRTYPRIAFAVLAVWAEPKIAFVAAAANAASPAAVADIAAFAGPKLLANKHRGLLRRSCLRTCKCGLLRIDTPSLVAVFSVIAHSPAAPIRSVNSRRYLFRQCAGCNDHVVLDVAEP
jgi:hypothetical protein